MSFGIFLSAVIRPVRIPATPSMPWAKLPPSIRPSRSTDLAIELTARPTAIIPIEDLMTSFRLRSFVALNTRSIPPKNLPIGINATVAAANLRGSMAARIASAPAMMTTATEINERAADKATMSLALFRLSAISCNATSTPTSSPNPTVMATNAFVSATLSIRDSTTTETVRIANAWAIFMIAPALIDNCMAWSAPVNPSKTPAIDLRTSPPTRNLPRPPLRNFPRTARKPPIRPTLTASRTWSNLASPNVSEIAAQTPSKASHTTAANELKASLIFLTAFTKLPQICVRRSPTLAR